MEILESWKCEKSSSHLAPQHLLDGNKFGCKPPNDIVDAEIVALAERRGVGVTGWVGRLNLVRN